MSAMQQTSAPSEPHASAVGSSATAPVSVVILTLNEAVNIRACIESCEWCDDVHVLDSGSTDETQLLARSCGAVVHEHPFESFGRQRNWAIDHIPVRHDWIFHLDADERFTPELVAEMQRVLRNDPPEAGFHVPSKLMFMGRWLKHAGGYPTYQMRLFHRKRMRFADHGHGQREHTQGSVGTLREPYLHYNFSKGLDDWFDKHNRYSTLEAQQELEAEGESLRFGDVFSRERLQRRRALKAFSHRLPCRPLLRWLYTMFVLGAVLDGRPGWTYARLLTMYERMIVLKRRELQAGSTSE